ncbi:MAG: hypothetical protein EBU46_07075 [Nitrosomonadaceae bacterium]|nr:hypothetical protein [Nitrosomonadaceae bacterium]
MVYKALHNIEKMEADWFNNRRLLVFIGNIPSAKFEMAYYCQAFKQFILMEVRNTACNTSCSPQIPFHPH